MGSLLSGFERMSFNKHVLHPLEGAMRGGDLQLALVNVEILSHPNNLKA